MDDIKGKKFNSIKSLEKSIIKRFDSIYSLSYTFGMYGKDIIQVELGGFGELAIRETNFKDKLCRKRKRFTVLSVYKTKPSENIYENLCGKYPY